MLTAELMFSQVIHELFTILVCHTMVKYWFYGVAAYLLVPLKLI